MYDAVIMVDDDFSHLLYCNSMDVGVRRNDCGRKEAATMFNITQCLLSCLFLMIGFLLLCKPKYSLKKTIFLSMGILLFCVAIFSVGVYLGMQVPMAAAIFLSLPSLVFFYFLSEYKGFRYLFTFCSADLFGIIVMGVSNSINIAFGLDVESVWLLLLEYIVLFSGVYAVLWKVRKPYLEIQAFLKKGWGSLALLSVTFYALVYIIMGYPKPLRERMEYIPVLLAVLMAILITYLVIYQFIRNMKKKYEIEEAERALKVQLKEKELYYQMAYIDPMTKLKNRAYLARREKEFEESWESYLPMVLIALDINNLKLVNDTYGHACGDSIISKTAKLLKSVFPDCGDLYRLGGDEFMVILTTMEEPLDEIIGKVKRAAEMEGTQGQPGLSIAIGAARQTEGGVSPFTVAMKAADKKMYEDKRRYKTETKF